MDWHRDQIVNKNIDNCPQIEVVYTLHNYSDSTTQWINDKNGYIPIISITGNGNYSFVNRFISSFFTFTGKYVGSYGKKGLYLDNVKKDQLLSSKKYENVKSLLMNKKLEVAVVDNSSKQILKEGLFFKFCNAVVLGKINPITYKSDCVLNEPVDTPKIIRTVTTLVPKEGFAVLCMDDPNIDQLMKDFDGKIIYYTENTQNIYGKKNRIVSVNDNNIALYHNGSQITIENTLKKYNKKYNKYDVMAAIGGIWTYYDIMDNNEILQKFITNYHKLKYKIY